MSQQDSHSRTMSMEHRNEALLLWQLHETLLQSYRSLFFSFQAIALTAGGFVSFQVTGGFVWDLLHIAIIAVLSAAGPLFVFGIWMPIVSHRHRMVSFAQWLLRANQSLESSPFDLIGQFSDERSPYHQSIVARDDYQRLLKGPTRLKLDRIVPLAFAILWILLLLWRMLGAG